MEFSEVPNGTLFKVGHSIYLKRSREYGTRLFEIINNKLSVSFYSYVTFYPTDIIHTYNNICLSLLDDKWNHFFEKTTNRRRCLGGEVQIGEYFAHEEFGGTVFLRTESNSGDDCVDSEGWDFRLADSAVCFIRNSFNDNGGGYVIE